APEVETHPDVEEDPGEGGENGVQGLLAQFRSDLGSDELDTPNVRGPGAARSQRRRDSSTEFRGISEAQVGADQDVPRILEDLDDALPKSGWSEARADRPDRDRLGQP